MLFDAANEGEQGFGELGEAVFERREEFVVGQRTGFVESLKVIDGFEE
jgi:hypothetical protein